MKNDFFLLIPSIYHLTLSRENFSHET